jgi:hypothetical protein
MADTLAIYALRRKRAHLAGEIEQAMRLVAKKRETLATLDAVIRLFEPESNPELIATIRPVSARRCAFFRHGEIPRLCLLALREAGKPVPCRYVAECATQAKGLDVNGRVRKEITETVRQSLARLAAKGLARKIVEWPETWWELAL